MGKTAQLPRFQRQFPDGYDKDTWELQRHIVIVNVSTEPTKTTLQFSLLEGSMYKLLAMAGGRALEEYIARRKQRHFVDLMGKLEWHESFDLKLNARGDKLLGRHSPRVRLIESREKVI